MGNVWGLQPQTALELPNERKGEDGVELSRHWESLGWWARWAAMRLMLRRLLARAPLRLPGTTLQ